MNPGVVHCKSDGSGDLLLFLEFQAQNACYNGPDKKQVQSG